jgi:hypothetical protein
LTNPFIAFSRIEPDFYAAAQLQAAQRFTAIHSADCEELQGSTGALGAAVEQCTIRDDERVEDAMTLSALHLISNPPPKD